MTCYVHAANPRGIQGLEETTQDHNEDKGSTHNVSHEPTINNSDIGPATQWAMQETSRQEGPMLHMSYTDRDAQDVESKEGTSHSSYTDGAYAIHVSQLPCRNRAYDQAHHSLWTVYV